LPAELVKGEKRNGMQTRKRRSRNGGEKHHRGKNRKSAHALCCENKGSNSFRRRDPEGRLTGEIGRGERNEKEANRSVGEDQKREQEAASKIPRALPSRLRSRDRNRRERKKEYTPPWDSMQQDSVTRPF